MVTNDELEYKQERNITLAPGESTTFVYDSSIKTSHENLATVIATPRLPHGTIGTSGKVSSQDVSAVSKLVFDPAIKIENTVYLSHDDGAKCGSSRAVDFVSGVFGANVTYCFKVRQQFESPTIRRFT